MNTRLTTKEKWEGVWMRTRLPHIAKPQADVRRQLTRFLPADASLSCCEIGCAPGGWMAWLHRTFGYKVEGIEYAEAAAELCKRNLQLLEIPSQVHVKDFFADDVLNHRYDIVFSMGFIEHFKDVGPVIRRHCDLARKYVVIMVPNCYGVNGFISKTIRPKVYAEHNPIDKDLLGQLGTETGLRTVFCNYVGGVNLIMPAAGRMFFQRHRLVTRVLNLPVSLINRVSILISEMLHFTPRVRWCSSTLMFIGAKPRE